MALYRKFLKLSAFLNVATTVDLLQKTQLTGHLAHKCCSPRSYESRDRFHPLHEVLAGSLCLGRLRDRFSSSQSRSVLSVPALPLFAQLNVHNETSHVTFQKQRSNNWWNGMTQILHKSTIVISITVVAIYKTKQNKNVVGTKIQLCGEGSMGTHIMFPK